MQVLNKLSKIHASLLACRKCPNVCDNAVHGPALTTKIMIVGQAPGVHEKFLGKPFAYTAGKTLFKWLGSVSGKSEDQIRSEIYFSAVARCFPGKALKGSGDREPNATEIENCRSYLHAEIKTLKPHTIIAVGKIAIRELLGVKIHKNFLLNDAIGKKFQINFQGLKIDIIPLPHPSGVSRWIHSDLGKKLLQNALKLIGHIIKQ